MNISDETPARDSSASRKQTHLGSYVSFGLILNRALASTLTASPFSSALICAFRASDALISASLICSRFALRLRLLTSAILAAESIGPSLGPAAPAASWAASEAASSGLLSCSAMSRSVCSRRRSATLSRPPTSAWPCWRNKFLALNCAVTASCVTADAENQRGAHRVTSRRHTSSLRQSLYLSMAFFFFSKSFFDGLRSFLS